MNLELVSARLEKDEGSGPPGRPFTLYRDPKGLWTIGFGFLVDPSRMGATIPLEIAQAWLKLLLFRIVADPPAWFLLQDEVRQNLIICLVYNMGLKVAEEFKLGIAALIAKDYNAAANQLEDSKWFGEVGDRGPLYVNIMRTGIWPTQ